MVNLMVSSEPLNFVCQGLWFGVEPKNLEQRSDSKVWVEAWEEKPSAGSRSSNPGLSKSLPQDIRGLPWNQGLSE